MEIKESNKENIFFENIFPIINNIYSKITNYFPNKIHHINNNSNNLNLEKDFPVEKIKINFSNQITNNNNSNNIISSNSQNQINNLPIDNTEKNEIIIVITRHGERADLAGEKVQLNRNDPELTKKGIKQAYEAGTRLKEILDLFNQTDKKIAILTSPFSRCLMTAKYMKNGMNFNLPLFIENGLSEFINKQWFKENPSDFLCYFNTNEILFKELENEIIIDNSLIKLPSFPESTNKCSERFYDILDLVIERYSDKNGFNILVLVTHFFGIQCLCEKMNIPLDSFDIEYCSTFIFKYNKENKSFKFEKYFYPIEE